MHTQSEASSRTPWAADTVSDERWNEPGYPQKARMKGRLAAIFVRLWVNALHVDRLGWDHVDQARRTGKPLLYVVWHGSQVVPLAFFRDRGIIILTSLSRDGDIQDICMKSLGFRTIRGSSTRGGARALLGLVREVKKHGTAAIAVDGPRGPYRSAKPGAVLLAQKTGAAVIPVGVAHTRCHRLKSWDKFEIPVPFSRSVLSVGPHFFIDAALTPEEGGRLIETHIAAAETLAERQVRP
jgi:hypothetical protein